MEKAPIMALFAYGPFKLCPGRQAHMINGHILSLSGASRHSYWWRKRLKGLSHGIVIRCNKAEKYTWMKWSARNRRCFIQCCMFHIISLSAIDFRHTFLDIAGNDLCLRQRKRSLSGMQCKFMWILYIFEQVLYIEALFYISVRNHKIFEISHWYFIYPFYLFI